MTKKRLIIAAIALALIAGAVWFATSQNRPSITTATVAVHRLETTVTANGTVRDPAAAEVFADGVLQRVAVTDGQTVTAAQVLAELDPERLQLAVTKAEAELAAAYAMSTDSDRLKTARWRAIKAVELALAQAQAQLDKAVLKAPKAGIVLGSPKPGQTVHSNQAVYTIVSDLRFVAQVDESDIAAVQAEQTAQVKLDAFAQPLVGKVTSITPTSITTSTGQVAYPVTIEVAPAGLLNGMSGETTITTAIVENALAVPRPAVWVDKGEHFVFRIDGEVAHKTGVTVGPQSDQLIQIVSGLGEADVVATSGIATLTEGAKVHVK